MRRILLASMLLFVLQVLVQQPVTAAVDVFVSIPPQKWLTDRIGGKHVTTRVLVKNGQNPHTFEPTPRQVMALAKSRLYFSLDMPFEEQILRKVQQVAPNLRIVDTAHHLQKIPLATHGHTDDHDNNHLPQSLDPHVWLSPPNLKVIATEMADALMDADPTNLAVYSENLTRLHGELDLLHDKITRELIPFAGASFYVFHPSFGYFAHTYGLHQQAVEIEGKSPTPKQLSSLIAKARADEVKVIFVQPQFDAGSVRVVAGAIGGVVVPLDPLAEDVAANLEIMADKIREALPGRQQVAR